MSWPGQVIANRSLPGREGRDRLRESARERELGLHAEQGWKLTSWLTGQID